MRQPLLDRADIRLLRIFAAVVEAGGFAAAQPGLDLGLSTITTHVATLESRLGVKLCRRGRAGFALTEAGAIVHAEARRLIAAADGFSARVGALRDRMAGPVRLGVLDALISNPASRLSVALADFAEKAPESEITLICRPPDELLREVSGGGLDLALGSFPRVALGLDYADLYEERQGFYCGAGHPLFWAADSGIDIEEIRRCRIVARSYWGQRDVKGFAGLRVGAVVSDMESEAHLILSGAFLGHLPEHYAAPFVAAGRMRALDPARWGYRAPFQLASRPGALETPRVAALAEALRAAHGKG